MSYLIAVASLDEKNVDLSFGAAEGFHVYSIDGLEIKKIGYRKLEENKEPDLDNSVQKKISDSLPENFECSERPQCGNGKGCGSGCHGAGGLLPKVELIADCRSLVCKKIGFQAQKQLEQKKITSFDVDCSVNDALTKISAYFDKIDRHISLRKDGV